jgi:hypothetical protein
MSPDIELFAWNRSMPAVDIAWECVGEPHTVEADGKSPDARLPKSRGMRHT